MATVSVHLDSENQIIEQRIEGVMSIDDFGQLFALTDDAATRLADRSEIRILVDAREMGPTSLATRKRGRELFAEHNIRMAFWGGPRLVRVVQRLIGIVVGESRVRSFSTAKEARAWLCGTHAPLPHQQARSHEPA
jgi:hypothetical protein